MCWEWKVCVVHFCLFQPVAQRLSVRPGGAACFLRQFRWRYKKNINKQNEKNECETTKRSEWFPEPGYRNYCGLLSLCCDFSIVSYGTVAIEEFTCNFQLNFSANISCVHPSCNRRSSAVFLDFEFFEHPLERAHSLCAYVQRYSVCTNKNTSTCRMKPFLSTLKITFV